jgi:E3 ubiquitin-protein ligase SHPRH
MHISTSHHNESIRMRVSDIWPTRIHANLNFRPSLNIQELSNLIHIATSEESREISGKGKKRAAKPPPGRTRGSKRAKTPTGSIKGGGSESSKDSKDSEDYVWPDTFYPEVSADVNLSKDVEVVPVFQHAFEIQYTTHPPAEQVAVDDEEEAQADWKLEENNLHEILADLGASPAEPRTIDLGEVRFAAYDGRLVVITPALKNRAGGDAWIMLLPSLTQDFDLAWHDMASPLVEDLMMAWHMLKSAGRAEVEARLKITILPSDSIGMDEHELPFRLQIAADLSLILPTIFEPLPRAEIKKKVLQLEDVQRRVLDALYPSQVTTPESFGGVVNIPFFYSVLCPAPSLESAPLREAMQPDELNPTLLPFQRRSVSWLLDREGKTMSPAGKIIPKSESSDFTLWEKIEEGDYTWYLNRLSGALSCTLPPATPVLGGILAEEPGLGKTLETITLILMNPAPERNPTISRWDFEAKLEVKAIKVSWNYA